MEDILKCWQSPKGEFLKKETVIKTEKELTLQPGKVLGRGKIPGLGGQRGERTEERKRERKEGLSLVRTR